jgi:ankyrin repeat protein
MNLLKLLLFILLVTGGGVLSGCAAAKAPQRHGGGVYGGFSMTALYEAAYRGDLQQARQLLDSGATVDAQTDYGMTPLTVAIWKGHTDVVRLLVARGANVNLVSTRYGSTPLTTCGKYGNAEMARLLVNAGANLAAKDKDGKNAEFYATDNKKPAILGVLRKAGWPVSYNGKNDKDIVIAAVGGDKEKVLELITAGVKPNSEIDNNKQLLMYAVEWDWPEVVALLLKKKADADSRDNDGWTAMMHAARDNRAEILHEFELAGVKLSYSGNAKEDLLVAVLAGDREKVAALLAQQGEVNSRYRYNSPLLTYAVVKKDLAMVTMLLDHKANPNLVNDSGISPFLAALMQHDLVLVKLLLARGADVNARSRTGFTALMYAIAYTDADTVKVLLARGAEPDANAVILSQGGNTNYPKVNLPEITTLLKPELLRRQMIRAQAAVEAAQTQADFYKAVQEYELARRISPESAEIYYNLGLVQEKAGAYGDAITNLRQYLRLDPAARDAEAVRDMVYKLEYKRDQAARPAAVR